MDDEKAIFVPATPYDGSKEKGRFSRFDPGTRTLPQGFTLGKPYSRLPVDIVFEKDVAVQLRDGVTIYVDVFRPIGSEKVPVIIAWSPYGRAAAASRRSPRCASAWACLRRRQLLQHFPLHRNLPGLAEHRVAGQMAPHPQQDGVAGLLPRGERPGPEEVLRPLPQGRGERLDEHAAGALLTDRSGVATTSPRFRRWSFPRRPSRTSRTTSTR